MLQKKFTKRSGFTLIEVTVALAILGLIIATIVYVGNQSYRIAREAKHRVSAMGWSQQGLNAVQLKKDTNLLNSTAQMSGLDDGTYYLVGDTLTKKCISTNITDTVDVNGTSCDIPTTGTINNDNRTFTQKIIIKKITTP